MICQTTLLEEEAHAVTKPDHQYVLAFLVKLKEEQRLVELETRKASMKKRKELEIAKLESKLKEEERKLDTDIAISNAKSEVLQKFELKSELNDSIDSNNREAEEVTPRRFLQKPSPRVVLTRDEAELDNPRKPT